MNFGQVITAMVTPFDENGDINFEATKELIEHLIANGTDGVVVAGTTGESPTLTKEEKIDLFTFVIKEAAGRLSVIAGTGSNNTRESIELTKEAERLGADGVMLVVPYYNKPCQDGLYAHFTTIANATNLPIMLYNIPGRSSVNMDVETIVRLSKVKNIVCVKEASGDLGAMTEIISQTDDDFAVYSGDDGLTLPLLSIGGKGIVSVAAHVLGNEMKEMIEHYNQGRVAEAGAMHRKLLPLFDALFSAPNPTPLKAVMNFQGLNVGSVRLPLVPVSEAQEAMLKTKFELATI